MGGRKSERIPTVCFLKPDSQSSAKQEPWLLFACASPYVNANPLVWNRIYVHKHTLKKEMLLSPQPAPTKNVCPDKCFPTNLCLAFRKQLQVSICCVYGRPKLCLFTFFLPLWSAPRHSEEFNYMVTGALTRPRFCFNHPTVRYKKVQGRLCYVCVCARSGQWAMQWHQQAHWDRDGEILILDALYENMERTSGRKLAPKWFTLI